MALPDNYVDNQMPYGSRVETIKRGGGAGTAVGVYVFDNIQPDSPSRVIERTNEIGRPSGFAIVPSFVTGSGTLQLATAAQPVPKIGDWFNDQFDESTAGTTANYVLEHVGQPFTKDGYRVCNVTFRLSENPPTA